MSCRVTFIMILACGLEFSLLAQVVNITDPVLEQAIRSGLSKPSGDITRDDLSNLLVLNLRDRQLDSLILPEGLIGLESLDLSFNQLSSFTLPEDLLNLKSLNLSFNQLTSFILPKGMTSMRTLDLSRNELTSFTLPGDLGNLENLFLGGNELTSFTFLKGLANLSLLSIESNKLPSLTLPVGLDGLIILDLRDNPITTLRVPTGFDLEGLFLLAGFEKADVVFYETKPRLRIRLDIEANEVAIYWESSADISELQSSSDLANWQRVEAVPRNADQELVTKQPIDKNRQFFRLIRLAN